MALLLDRCRFTPTAGGTADWTYSAATLGFMSPGQAGAQAGKTYKFVAESGDLTQWEMCEGVWDGTKLSRTTVLYNSLATGSATGQSGAGNKINFTTTPQVMIVALKEDIPALTEANTFAGINTFSNSTASTTYNNGALVVGGGVGIAGALNCNGAGSFASLATVASFTIGAGGTGVTNAIQTINGGSGAASGPVALFQKNSVNKWHFAPASYSLGSGTSDDFTLFNYGTTTTVVSVSFSTNLMTVTKLASPGTILSTTASGGIGHGTGAGGTVTQATSKATAVTLNALTGTITLNASALAAATTASFVFNNSSIAATDHLLVSHDSGGTSPGSYTVNGRATGSAIAAIDVRNNTAGSLSEALVLRFTVIKSVNS